MWQFAQHKKHQTCGRAARGDAVFIDVSEREDGSRHGAARGLVSCSSVWCCPVCAAHIRTERAQELAQGVAEHRAQGGSLLFVTLTMRHQRGEALGQLLDVLYAAWRRVQQQRGWRTLRDDGLSGFVRSLEITYGRAGWHPHLHLLLFLDGPTGPTERDQLHDWLTRAWLSTLERMGRSALAGVGVDVQRVTDDAGAWERIAGYTVKGEAVHLEVARGDLKRGRGSLSPMQLLDVAGNGEAWAIRAWQEYEDATAGRRAIEWSRGLRDRLGIGAERADADIVDDAVADAVDVVHTETVAVLTPLEWRAIVAESSGFDALEAAAGNLPGVSLHGLVQEAVKRWHSRRRQPA